MKTTDKIELFVESCILDRTSKQEQQIYTWLTDGGMTWFDVRLPLLLCILHELVVYSVVSLRRPTLRVRISQVLLFFSRPGQQLSGQPAGLVVHGLGD